MIKRGSLYANSKSISLIPHAVTLSLKTVNTTTETMTTTRKTSTRDQEKGMILVVGTRKNTVLQIAREAIAKDQTRGIVVTNGIKSTANLTNTRISAATKEAKKETRNMTKMKSMISQPIPKKLSRSKVNL